MNKKILLKTLLPIATVALLGGGIASSLVLTSCSNKQDVWLNSSEDVWNYLKANKKVLPRHVFSCTKDTGDSDMYTINNVEEFFDYLYEKSTKKNLVNSLVAFGYFGGGSGVLQSVHIYDISGKTHVDITANKNINFTINYFKSFYDFSIYDGSKTTQVNESSIDFTNSSAYYNFKTHSWYFGIVLDDNENDFNSVLNPHDADKLWPENLA